MKLGWKCENSEVLKEVQPSTVLYSPSGKRDERAHVLGQLIPEIVDGTK